MQAYITHQGRRLYLGCFQHEEHAAKVRDLMAIKLRGMHTPLNFVPKTYNDMYKLLAQVDQALLVELLRAYSRAKKAKMARQQQRMTLEAALVHDLMAIKCRGMHTTLNFVPETYKDLYKLLARVDQVSCCQ
ncbi:uncharacterized protein HaLaN_20975 [Haematococcus lacustris]|uniref:AP2/ERF domain-containing protein n=1 Tax=Haematococcus lacustris TaxID=44745 RepID=A0A6A0A273_HAELA|nr:uncharacterized protein HaLaN_20975 [Haematococcus lacustris]